MREINVSEIENTIRDLCISANIHLPKSLEDKIQSCAELEISPAGKAVFEDLKANINAAKAENIPICQDTGMAVIFMEIGQYAACCAYENSVRRQGKNRRLSKRLWK